MDRTSGAVNGAPIATWNIPLSDGSALDLTPSAGDVYTFIGANGAGKSALASWLSRHTLAERRHRIIAHRQVWFSSAATTMHAPERASELSNFSWVDEQSDSRYVDHRSERSNTILYDMASSVGLHQRRENELFRSGKTADQVGEILGPAPIDQLNSILKAAGLAVELRYGEDNLFYANHARLGAEYPIFQMSDGEKNALLMAAEVVTAPVGQLIIIDEPERHLHRSISASLIENIVTLRSDCAFAIFTHDLELASSLRLTGDVFSVDSCVWNGEEVVSWTLHQVPGDSDLPESVREGILGGRGQILFVEGRASSLDVGLYQLLFPERTIVPAGGSHEVKQAVAGLRKSTAQHWVTAAGIVDGDARSADEREALRDGGVIALPVNEIESLFFISPVLVQVASDQAAHLDTDAATLIAAAKMAAFDQLVASDAIERAALKQARDAINRQVQRSIPAELGTERVSIEVDNPFASLRARYQELLDREEYDSLIRELSIRDTGVPNKIARAMKFSDLTDYQRVARRLLKQDAGLREKLVTMIGPIPA
ncbi:AAA family ATPase [Microbacterium aquilitoris]|uniref:AAA family ATPase n=1 Tax=Microbacterium aquilitoris TaxID=3067307 RepID=UPI0028909FCA|nr:AAA family ATPase [Microbacterium sp. KSW2-22]MDT3343760.1 AAA family ATPase [Microbacterium sp. KSW2-22]